MAILVAGAMFLGATDTTFSSGNFAPDVRVKLCVEITTACTADLPDNLVTGAYADITVQFDLASGHSMAALTVGFTPLAESIPGAETNLQCLNATDEDGDGLVNDGCAPQGSELESDRCASALDDDTPDDLAAADPAGKVNDGCPQEGDPEAPAYCNNASDDDSDNKVNDGCYPGGYGGAQLETGAQCSNATDDDPRDDAAGGGSRVNDGCPLAGAHKETGPECENAVNDDPADDSLVNDGCYTTGSAGFAPFGHRGGPR